MAVVALAASGVPGANTPTRVENARSIGRVVPGPGFSRCAIGRFSSKDFAGLTVSRPAYVAFGCGFPFDPSVDRAVGTADVNLMRPAMPGGPGPHGTRGSADTASDNSVKILLSGSITANCSVGGGGNLEMGELSVPRRAVARFDLGCNLPFELVFRSSSGGIVHNERPQGEGPYVGTVPYRLDVTIPALSPQPMQLRADFTSDQMFSGGVLTSGEAIAAGGGEISLQTMVPGDRDLLAGEYIDTISIMINPRI